MDGGLQHRTPAFPPGLSLTTGVHCITQTSRVSGLTGSTPRALLGTERHFIQKADNSRSVEANAERAPLSSRQNEVCRKIAVRLPPNCVKVAPNAIKAHACVDGKIPRQCLLQHQLLPRKGLETARTA